MSAVDDLGDRVLLKVEQAMEVLDVRDGEVHTFTNPAGMLVGTTWAVAEVKRYFELNGAELAGEQAASMGHGVASLGGRHRVVFFATRDDALAEMTGRLGGESAPDRNEGAGR